MNVQEIKKLIKRARSAFGEQNWGYDDDDAVDAYIDILLGLVEENANEL